MTKKVELICKQCEKQFMGMSFETLCEECEYAQDPNGGDGPND